METSVCQSVSLNNKSLTKDDMSFLSLLLYTDFFTDAYVFLPKNVKFLLAILVLTLMWQWYLP